MTPAASKTPAPSAPATAADLLLRHPPFEHLKAQDLAFVLERSQRATFPGGTLLVAPDSGPPDHLFILLNGRARTEISSDQGESVAAWDLGPGSCFPLGAMVEQRAALAAHFSLEEVDCLLLPAAAFGELLERSGVFRTCVTKRMADLLKETMRQVRKTLAAKVAGDMRLNAPLGELTRRGPVACPQGTPIQAVLEVMDRERVGSMVILDAAEAPVGVFTLHDLLRRVAVPGLDQGLPIDRVMTPNPAALSATGPAFEAALVMASGGFGHVLVTDRGRLAGVVSERDLFALQRVGVVNLSRCIGRAADVADLKDSRAKIHRLTDQMLAQGASVEQLTQIIATLNDLLTRRIIDLCLGTTTGSLPPLCWLSFGSEGRQEQTLHTDQDNGLVFQVPKGQSPGALRKVLLPLAGRVNEALAGCGFAPCPGHIMASNPDCCLSTDEWRERFGQWIEQGTPKHLLQASIFFDFRALWGESKLAADLRDWVAKRTPKNPRFLRQLATNALRNPPPLGLVRDFVLSGGDEERPHTLDLKMSGSTPFVDGARILALAHGVKATNTLARLRGAADAKGIRKEEAAAWHNAYSFILLLRMRNHQTQGHQGQPLDNRIDPDQLNELDRHILKEAFRQARKLQSRLGLDYRLNL